MNEFKSYVWKKEFNIGIENIDNQHQELFKRIDKLLLAIYNNEEKKELLKLEKFMLDYIEEHFTLEEKLMKKNDYPFYENHKNEHNNFISMYYSFKDEMNNKGAGIYLANRMVKDLYKWWENHILKSDMLFKPYVKLID